MNHRPLLFGFVVFLAVSCGEGTPTTTPSATDPASSPTSVDDRPLLSDSRFAGVQDVVAGEDWIWVRWSPAVAEKHSGDESFRYRVYLADRGESLDEIEPAYTTEPGATEATIRGLATGAQLDLRVRSIDQSEREDSNRVTLRVTPSPVLRVDPASDSDQMYRTISDALDSAVEEECANIWVTSGVYEERLVLFGGITIYGGFQPGFSTADRMREGSATILSSTGSRDLIVVAPEDRWTGLSSVELDGGDRGERGLVADDCRLFLHQVTVHRFARRAIHLRADEDEHSFSRLSMTKCSVKNCAREGILVEGAANVSLDGCVLVGNGQEGIELDPLSSAPGRRVGISMRGCRVRANGDIGVDIELAWPDLDGVEPPRIAIEGCWLEDNRGPGLAIDTPESTGENLRCHVEISGCSFRNNDGPGTRLDADYPGRYSVTHCLVYANDGGGVVLTGDSDAAEVSFDRVLMIGSSDVGLRLACDAGVAFTACGFAKNSVAVHYQRGHVSWSQCRRSNSSVIEGGEWPGEPMHMKGVEVDASALSEDAMSLEDWFVVLGFPSKEPSSSGPTSEVESQ